MKETKVSAEFNKCLFIEVLGKAQFLLSFFFPLQ